MILSLSLILIINIFIVINFDNISKFLNIYDFPDQKLKIHKKKVSLMGGTIIVLNIFLILIFDLIFKIINIEFFLAKKELLSFLFVLIFFYFLGLYDDKHNIKPNFKFFLSLLISIFYTMTNENIIINSFSISIYEHRVFLENFSIPFTVFCILILINAMNFFDGINGQSLIFFLIIFSFLLLKTLRLDFYLFIIIIILFCLYLNLKNMMFLGDNGIYVLTIVLITSIIYEHNIYKQFIYADEIFFLLLFPGIDLLRLTFSRLINGKNPFYGDRKHVHHLMINRYSLLISNIFLIFLSILPIFLYSIFNLNFYAVFSIFLIIYSLIIKNLLHDK